MTTAWRTLSTSMAISTTVGNSAWVNRQVKNNLYSVWCRPILHEPVSIQRQTNTGKLSHKIYVSFWHRSLFSLSVANVTIEQWLDVAIHTVFYAWCILSVITCGFRQQKYCTFCLVNTPPKLKCASSQLHRVQCDFFVLCLPNKQYCSLKDRFTHSMQRPCRAHAVR